MIRALLTVAALTAATAAQAQVTVGVEGTSDEVRRGLSWTSGRAAASADAALSFGPLDASARVVSLRESRRHAGADAVADLELAASLPIPGFDLRAAVTGHVFAGAAESMDYAEVSASGAYSLGPLRATLGASYAPDQDAIGGDNLYLFAAADAGLPATPLTLNASVGRSTGSTDDLRRAARLRPGGDYTDWRVGAAWVRGPLTLSLDYHGNDADRTRVVSPLGDAGNLADRVVGRVRYQF